MIQKREATTSQYWVSHGGVIKGNFYSLTCELFIPCNNSPLNKNWLLLYKRVLKLVLKDVPRLWNQKIWVSISVPILPGSVIFVPSPNTITRTEHCIAVGGGRPRSNCDNVSITCSCHRVCALRSMSCSALYLKTLMISKLYSIPWLAS